MRTNGWMNNLKSGVCPGAQAQSYNRMLNPSVNFRIKVSTKISLPKIERTQQDACVWLLRPHTLHSCRSIAFLWVGDLQQVEYQATMMDYSSMKMI